MASALPAGVTYDTPIGVGGKINTNTGQVLTGPMAGQTAGIQTSKSTPSAFSSTAGADALTKSVQQATKLTGTPMTGTPTTPANTPETPQTPATTPSGPQNSTTMVNPATGQEYTITTPDAATVKKFTDNGWSVSEGTGDGTGVVPADPNLQAAQEATTQAKSELDSAKTRLTSFAPTLANDPMLSKIMSSITADWDARLGEMTKYNEGVNADIRTTAYRNGLQYTGGKGGTWGGAISSEETAGLSRLATLETEKQQALTNASLAYEKQKWGEYSDLVDRAQKAYDDQTGELLKLQTSAQAQSEKIATARRQTDLEAAIGSIVGGGITDAGDIQKYLRAQGATDVSLKEIGDALKILNPSADLTGLSTDFRTFTYLQSRKDPAVAGMDYFSYVRAVHNATRAPAKGTGTGPDSTAPTITWDAFLSQQEEKMQANIAPDTKLYNDLRAQWEQLGGGHSGKSPFSIKDQANGAQNAGLAIDHFPSLPLDVQNFYVKAPQAQINVVNKELSAVRDGSESAENAKKWIASSQITDQMKEYLNSKVDEAASGTGSGTPAATNGGVMSELGSGFHSVMDFLGI